MNITNQEHKNENNLIEFGIKNVYQLEYYTEIMLKYRLKPDLPDDTKQNLYRKQQLVMQPFMDFYEELLNNDLIETIE